MPEYAADDFDYIANRLKEIRRISDEIVGATIPAPTDAQIKPPARPDSDDAHSTPRGESLMYGEYGEMGDDAW